MPVYAAFLRGIYPTNTRMTDLVRAFEAAGFGQVRTVLGSGNVVFTAPRAAEGTLVRRAEAALARTLGRDVMAFVRALDSLEALLELDPYRDCKVPAAARRVVTFLREPPAAGRRLPAARDGARIVKVAGREAYCVYVRTEKGPVFMRLIEEAFGEVATTRTWETVQKVVAAGRAPRRRSG